MNEDKKSAIWSRVLVLGVGVAAYLIGHRDGQIDGVVETAKAFLDKGIGKREDKSSDTETT